MTQHSISVCHQVSGLRFIGVTRGQVLLVWSDVNVQSRLVAGEGHGAELNWSDWLLPLQVYKDVPGGVQRC